MFIRKNRISSSPHLAFSLAIATFLSVISLFMSAAPAHAQTGLTPPSAVKCFDDFGWDWQQTVDVNDVDSNGDVIADLWFDTGAITSFSVPGPYPDAFGGPVFIKVHEVGVYDAGTNRANEGEQADEVVGIVLLKNGSVVWQSDWSFDAPGDDSLETGVNSAEFDYGALGTIQLQDGFDEVLMVHPSDPTYGYGVTAPNDYIPMGVCLEFEALGHVDGQVWCESASNPNQDYNPLEGDTLTPDVGVTIYTDANCDGTIDGPAVASTQTDLLGEYNFDSLPIGDAGSPICYVSKVDTSDADLNSCDSEITNPEIPVALDMDNPKEILRNFGFDETSASIGDIVWLDSNSNGQYDGEAGVAGVRVILWADNNGDGQTEGYIRDTFTDADGKYRFYGLTPNTSYVLSFVAPSGTTITQQNTGSDTTDSDGYPFNGYTGSYYLSEGEYNPTVDLGLIDDSVIIGSATLGDTVFLDANNNGAEDSGEVGIGGVDIIITNTADNSTTTVTTNASGQYFATLQPGSYTVAVDPSSLPAGLDSTYDFDGNNNGSTPVTLNDGDNLTNIDFGYHNPTTGGTASLGDTVFYDSNNNMSQDSGEPGIGNVDIIITNTADNSTTTVTTNASGQYFATLPAGNYTVAVDPTTLPTGVDNTYDLDGNKDGSTPVTLNIGDSLTNIDFGYYNPNTGGGTASLGDTVFYDTNNNMSEDSGEPGIGGVDIIITNTADNSTTTVTTNASGQYFATLPAGNYTVAVDPSTLPTGVNSTYDLDGNKDGSTPVTLNIGDNLTNIDFGYFSPNTGGTATLGDTIFFDANNNGTQDSNEPGIGDVDVIITDTSDNSTTTVTTGANGVYFATLPAGSYVVAVDPSTLPAGASNTYDLDGNNNSSTPVTLDPGDNVTNVDFGYKGVLALGNLVWEDTSGNAMQDEPVSAGINNVLVNLYRDDDANGVISSGDTFVGSTITAGDGSYNFDCLLPGDYIVQIPESNFTIGTGVLASYNDPAFYGGDPDNNNNQDNNGIVVPGQGVVSAPITLEVGQETLNNGNTNDTVDFAFGSPNGATSVSMSSSLAETGGSYNHIIAVMVMGLALISWSAIAHKRNRPVQITLED